MTEQTQEIQTITIGEKTFDVSSVTEHGKGLIGDIKRIEGELAHLQLQASIAEIARGVILEKLTEESVNFTEVAVEAEEVTASAE